VGVEVHLHLSITSALERASGQFVALAVSCSTNEPLALIEKEAGGRQDQSKRLGEGINFLHRSEIKPRFLGRQVRSLMVPTTLCRL
jgi:hypothetical protein